MSRLAGRRVLVTGASGGVGRELALHFARAGTDVVLLARREAELNATADAVRGLGKQAIVVVGDVTLPDDRDRALSAAQDQLGGLDVLVNNAGVGAHGRFHESARDRVRSVMELNFFAAVELTRDAIPLLSKSDCGCIANIGSILAWRGMPKVSEYCASKFALRGWSEAIRPEVGRLGIHVLHASPSTIETEFREHLVERREKLAWSGRRGVSPERVAERVVWGVERRRNEVAIIWEDWAIVRLARWAPWLLDRLTKRYG